MIGTIIQARVGSTRLPGKVLKEVLGKPLLILMLERVKKAKQLEKIIVAIPESNENDLIEKIVEENGFEVYRGSEDDVLERYFLAAKEFGIDPIVRLTSDCPLIDPKIVDQGIKIYKKNDGCDYITNIVDRTYPDGEDIEIISFKALENAFNNAIDKHDREHVTTYIGCRENEFKHKNFKYHKNLSHLRWTVDYPEDFEFVTRVFEELYPKKGISFTMEDILELLKEKPEIEKINKNILGKDNLKIANEKRVE